MARLRLTPLQSRHINISETLHGAIGITINTITNYYKLSDTMNIHKQSHDLIIYGL